MSFTFLEKSNNKKKKILQSRVKNKCFYLRNCKFIDKAEQKVLESFEMWCWRKMILDRTENELQYTKQCKSGKYPAQSRTNMGVFWDTMRSFCML